MADLDKPIIVFLHFAGGNRYSFEFLKPHLKEFHLVMIELPGRGKRTGERLIRDKEQAVDDLVEQLLKHNIESNFIVYGHSMGATLGLLLCEKLEMANIKPDYLVVSGSCGPGISDCGLTHLLKGEAFKDALRKLGGISELVLQEEELFEYFEPVIRADFELLEKDAIEPDRLLSVPIHAIMGVEENYTDHIQNWQRFTEAEVTTYLWPGNHFFIHDHPERLAALMKNCFTTISVSE